MNKITEKMIFTPAFEYIDNGIEHGVLSPFATKETILKKGEQIAPGFKALDCDIRYLKDIPVKMRDGVTIYTDIFLPITVEKVPVLIAWSPYGKSAGTAPRYINLFNMLGMGNGWNSGLTKFEAPDPAYWVQYGYAVCNPDARGIAHSEGDITMIGSQEAEDCYDLIEWLAEQDWSNQKTALSGTSYLAFSQWFIAAGQPPHLTCISPTEGLQDAYRDLAYIGGIPDPNFIQRLQVNHVSASGARREDMVAEMETHPLANCDLWEDKIADVSRITIPAYIVASYSNTLHTMGTFRSWRSIGSTEKWLRIHDSQEWPDYYDPNSTEELRRFFDHYLMGKQNGWEKTPQVRYSLLDLQGNNQTGLVTATFPPKESEMLRYYMSGRTRTLQLTADAEELPLRYFPEALPCRVSFQTTFEKDTTFIGYPKVKLFMEVENANDMDIFVWVQKIDKLGNVLSEFVVPNRNAALQDFTQDGASALRYKGPSGRLRASYRHLDPFLSTDDVPAYSFDRVEKLGAGEIVALEIVLSPIGMIYYAGDTLRVMISSKDEIGSIMPGTPGCISNNKGTHILHTGGQYASYLQMPLIR